MTARVLLQLALVGSLVSSFAFSAGNVINKGEDADFSGADALTWARRMADSEIARRGASWEKGNGRAKWDYSPAVFGLALWKLSDVSGDPAYRDFAARMVGSFVRADGTIDGLHLEQHSLDEINPGKVILLLAKQTHEQKYIVAAEHLRSALAQQPRTSEGGFWHKQRYPDQMWLDGLYMASPFLSSYAAQFNQPGLFDDVANQIILMDHHLYDRRTGLYWHGWDESKKAGWADPQAGHSHSFWGRSIGWYGMGIVDVLDTLPANHPKRGEIMQALKHVADGIVRWQDADTGLWWQIPDQGPRQGNYLEGSASAMFVYILAKAVNQGYLPKEVYEASARRGFGGLVSRLIKTDSDGRINLTQICESAGLSYTTSAGRARDGSYEYYLSEPVVSNDPKGTGPFVFAGIEMQALTSGSKVGRDRVAARDSDGWSSVANIEKRIHAPQFPKKDFLITNYGAKPGEPATTAILAAIDACAAANGGQVVVPPGDWSTGAIRLRSGVELHLAAGATLHFSTRRVDYPNVLTRFEGVECYNYSPLIYALDEHDIAVTGSGKLDGQAADENWWAWKKKKDDVRALNDMGERGVPVDQRTFGAGHFLRPSFVEMYRCRNVLIEGVTLVRSPMWEIHPVLCQNVTVRDVQVHSHGPNNDGCDPESSRDVLIEHCVFDTGDDCIAIKSGRNNDGRRVNIPSENIIVRDCSMQDGHGGVVIGSEVSGSVRNVFVEDCTMDSPNLDRGLRLKSNARRGGTIENVYLRRIRVGRVREAILTVDLLYEEGARGEHIPTVRNIHLDQVTSEHSPRVLWIAGFAGATIDDITFRDCIFRGVESAEEVSFAGLISFERVSIEPAQRHASLNTRAVP